MRADKVMVYIIIAVIVLVFWLLYLNRGSEKIFGAILVILTTTLATGLGSLLVILRPETRTEEFVTVFIYDSKENCPLLVESYPIRKRLGMDSALWSQPEEKEGVSGQPTRKPDVNDRLLDFLMRCIVERLAERFNNAWSIEAKAWSVPGADLSSWGPSKDAGNLPKLELPKGDVLQKMSSQGNSLAMARSETGGIFGKLILPPGTKVSYRGAVGQNDRELVLENPFVKLCITAQFNSMHVLQHRYYDIFQLDEANPNRYRQYSFQMRVNAAFSSWRAGREMMTHQKRWVESIIVLLKERFDWAGVAKEVKDAWTTKQLEKL